MESKETVGDPTQSPPALTAATDAHDPALMGEAHAPALERPRNGSVGSGDHQVVRPRIVRDLLSLQGGIFVVEALQLPPSFPGGDQVLQSHAYFFHYSHGALRAIYTFEWSVYRTIGLLRHGGQAHCVILNIPCVICTPLPPVDQHRHLQAVL